MSLEAELSAAIDKLTEIYYADATDPADRDEAKRHKAELERLRRRLRPQALRANLLGGVGVGKTSLLTALAGLYVGERPHNVDEQIARSILTIASGKTTAFPVRVRAPEAGEPQDKLGLKIDPADDEELGRVVETVAETELFRLKPAGDRNPDERPDRAGDEQRRVVLNMAGYPERKETYFEGNLKRQRIVRPIDEVARQLNTLPELKAHLLARIDQTARRGAAPRWFDDSPEGRTALRALFGSVNLGDEPSAPLPEEIALVVPWLRGGVEEEPLALLDTRGIDEDVIARADLFECLRDPDAVIVLCSSFVDAPSPRVRELLTALGRDLTLRAARARVVLVIIDKGEAARIIDADGDREVGQLTRGEDCRRTLENEGLAEGLSPERVVVFDPLHDDPAALLSALRAVHAKHHDHLKEQARRALAASRPLREGEAADKALRERLDLLIERALRDHPLEGEPLEDPLKGLKDTLKACPFAYRINAALRWQGTFRNLHLQDAIENTAKAAATAWLAPLQSPLLQRVREERDRQGADAQAYSALLEQIERGFEATVADYGAAVRGEVTALLKAAPVWREAMDEWGKGNGYRERVVSHFDRWGKLQPFAAHRVTTLAEHIPQLKRLQAPEDAPGFTLIADNLRRLKRLRWTLQGVNLLVGANGSGKTTVFTALRFFWRAMQEGGAELAAVMELKALSGLRTWRVEEDAPVRVALERGETRWEFELRPQGGGGLLIREHLVHRGGEVYSVGEDGRLTYRGAELGVVGRECGLRHLVRLKKVDGPLENMRRLAESLRISFSTDLVDILERGGARPLPARPLESRGQNVTSVLQRLKDAPGQAHKYEFVLEGLRAAFPQRVESLAFESTEQSTAVFVLPPGGELRPNPLSQEAEGLVQLLVNLVAVACGDPGDVIALDEPDSHLHPIAAKSFLHHVERWAWEHKLTVLIATHSIALLNEMWSSPERVFVMKRSPQTDALPMPLTDWFSKAWFADDNNTAIPLGRLAIGDLYATASLGDDDSDEKP